MDEIWIPEGIAEDKLFKLLFVVIFLVILTFFDSVRNYKSKKVIPLFNYMQFLTNDSSRLENSSIGPSSRF
jgi:hypothetical protein